MKITARDVGVISRRLAGLLSLFAGLVGSAWLLVATASPGALDSAHFYAPRTFVMVVMALIFIGLLEAGRLGLTDSEFGTVDPMTRRSPPMGLALNVAFLVPFFVVVAAGAVWTALTLATQVLSPTAATSVLAVCLLIYGAVRIPFALGWSGARDLAMALGLRRDRFETVEQQSSLGLRTVIGMAIGILGLDALIVLVNAVVAPGDTTFYPYVSALTPLASLLWIVALLATSSALTDALRGLRPKVLTMLALCAVAPAFLLDARVPLYPMVAGIFGR